MRNENLRCKRHTERERDWISGVPDATATVQGNPSNPYIRSTARTFDFWYCQRSQRNPFHISNEWILRILSIFSVIQTKKMKKMAHKIQYYFLFYGQNRNQPENNVGLNAYVSLVWIRAAQFVRERFVVDSLMPLLMHTIFRKCKRLKSPKPIRMRFDIHGDIVRCVHCAQEWKWKKRTRMRVRQNATKAEE